jgi:hypothetical protein
METLLILAAVAAVVIATILVARTMARAARPPLRLPHEDAMIEDEEDRLMDSLAAPPVSPIDRSANVLDLEPVERPKGKPADPRSTER